MYWQIHIYSYNEYNNFIMCGGIMVTKTQQSHNGMFIISAMIAALLIIIYQSLSQYSTEQVQAHNAADNNLQWQMSQLRENIVWSLRNTLSSWNKDIHEDNSLLVVAHTIPISENVVSHQVSVKENCIPIKVTDITSHIYHEALERAVQHCFISWYGNQRIYPDNHLTHNAMLVIAQAVGFDVDMSQWSDDIVSRSELIRFIEMLQSNKQISMVPVVHFSPIVTRAEYINFFRDSRDHEEAVSTIISTGSEQNVYSGILNENTTLTIKDIKTIINANSSHPLVIYDYDNDIIATKDMISSLLKETQSRTNTASPSSPESIWINKEIVKQWLSRLIQKI